MVFVYKSFNVPLSSSPSLLLNQGDIKEKCNKNSDIINRLISKTKTVTELTPQNKLFLESLGFKVLKSR